MIDPRSDQERVTPTAQPKHDRPRLVCPGHVWGGWMRDVIAIDTPGGKIFKMAPDTHYRRFCRVCKQEQKGRGRADGRNVEAI